MTDEQPKPSEPTAGKNGNRPKAFPIPTPLPDDPSKIHARPDDDDAVDFGQMPTSASGSAVLSHSQISGPLSGTSVVAWTDLMKARAEEEAKLQYDSLDNIDLDAASDQDLLAHALASEPPSGKLHIPNDDRPHGALSKEYIDLDAEENNRKRGFDDESVLSNLAAEDQSSSILSEKHLREMGSASHINLLARDEAGSTADAHTDEFDMARAMPSSGESSAVDLGSEPTIDLPFPSSGSSTGSGSRSKSGRSSASRRRADNSTVDLLSGASGGGQSSVPGITSVGSSMRPDSGLPATKRVEVVGGGSSGWLGGGIVGGLTGVAVCVGIWLSGALSPNKPVPNQNPAPTTPPADPMVAAVRSALEQAQIDPADPANAVTKLVNAKSEAENSAKQAIGDRQTIEASRKAMQEQLTESTNRAAQLADEKRKVDVALTAARDELQAKETERQRLDGELKTIQAKLAAPTPAPKTTPTPTPPPPSTDKGELTKLQEKVDALQTKSAELERELTAANRNIESLKQTLRDVGSFVAAVRQRLQAPAEAKPGELLTSLDTALAAKVTSEPGVPLPAYAADVRAERAFHRGVSAYRAGNLQDAERELSQAAGFHPRDARIWYFLGLAQMELGNREKAEASFRQAVMFERQNHPTSDSIDALLERMPPDARKLLNDIRRRG